MHKVSGILCAYQVFPVHQESTLECVHWMYKLKTITCSCLSCKLFSSISRTITCPIVCFGNLNNQMIPYTHPHMQHNNNYTVTNPVVSDGVQTSAPRHYPSCWRGSWPSEHLHRPLQNTPPKEGLVTYKQKTTGVTYDSLRNISGRCKTKWATMPTIWEYLETLIL